jgi:drug/metabolite transporter (DMT)-like permease
VHASSSVFRLAALTALALLAFAGNSLLCRQALGPLRMDPTDFTAIRLLSGATLLLALVRGRAWPAGHWPGALALLAYAALFSWAYVLLGAATGALLLFGAVQVTMVGAGLWRGERLGGPQWLGMGIAFGGLAWLLSPGLQEPPWQGALPMLGAGVAWGLYSLLGRRGGDPLAATAGHFLRAAPLALLLAWAARRGPAPPWAGVACALASGALASGLGYAVWYSVLPRLRASTAATLQLAVPVIATLGGLLWLGEVPTPRLLIAGLAVLGGIALVLHRRSG